MTIRREDSRFTNYDVILQQDDMELKMCLDRNLDLYWIVRKENKTGENFIFNITKENCFVYQVFDELYENIKNCNIFTLNKVYENSENIELINELNQDLKNTEMYSLIFNNEVVKWNDNNQKYKETDNLEIHKKDDEYLIKFNFKNKERSMNSICFMNSGSFYYPFNMVFINLYRKLKDYDQINIEEVIYQKRLELSNMNKNNN